MKKQDEEVEAFVSSGNIFEDLGYPNPEEAQAKSDLAMQIYRTLKKRKLTQIEAAEILGIDQPKVSDIIRGKLSKYSIDRLMRFLRLLGNDIEILVKKHRDKSSDPTLYVRGASENRPRASA